MKIENSFNPIDIAISGLKAQEKSIEAIASNVANARTIDSGDGQPYRRIETALKASNNGLGGVEVDGLIKDMSDFQKILASPGDPRADENGYISLPNVNLPEEMVAMSSASRAYKANAAVLKRYQTMVQTSLELLR